MISRWAIVAAAMVTKTAHASKHAATRRVAMGWNFPTRLIRVHESDTDVPPDEGDLTEYREGPGRVTRLAAIQLIRRHYLR